MALINIFNEPRREVTESAIGITVFIILAGLDYAFAIWFQHLTKIIDIEYPIFVGLLFGIFVMLAIWASIHLTHLWGESICNLLAQRGIELRPKRRYRE